jgi:hypothetical protein
MGKTLVSKRFLNPFGVEDGQADAKKVQGQAPGFMSLARHLLGPAQIFLLPSFIHFLSHNERIINRQFFDPSRLVGHIGVPDQTIKALLGSVRNNVR